MKIEVSNGEIVDKFTILKIKLGNCEPNTEKYNNILNEYNALKEAVDIFNIDNCLIEELFEINKALWNIEDEIRILENNKQFDQKFIDLARSVYITNDKRFFIKKKINLSTNSNFKEEKILPKY
jgi:nicotinic acid phosphoribosyltransferase